MSKHIYEIETIDDLSDYLIDARLEAIGKISIHKDGESHVCISVDFHCYPDILGVRQELNKPAKQTNKTNKDEWKYYPNEKPLLNKPCWIVQDWDNELTLGVAWLESRDGWESWEAYFSYVSIGTTPCYWKYADMPNIDALKLEE